ncbi:MAG: HEAT repeat domain-containing protein [Planctomycetota bacterium]
MEALSKLGGPDAEAAIVALLAEGPDVVDGVIAFMAGESEAATPHGGSRGFLEDLESLLHRLARAHPDRFERELESRPDLRLLFPVLSAIGVVETARATAWLLDALDGPDGSCRWLALSKLLDRRAPEAVPRLRGLLEDRDHLVGFEAACALRVHGGPEDVPALLAYADDAQIGGREYAWDSIEAICLRGGADLPETHPGPRLTTASVELVSADEPVTEIAERSQQVAEGEEVAEAPSVVLRAPIPGVLVGLDRDGRTLTATVRRR